MGTHLCIWSACRGDLDTAGISGAVKAQSESNWAPTSQDGVQVQVPLATRLPSSAFSSQTQDTQLQ